jgi:DNA-directed RNA polymerase specialized sigma24 family protein
LNRARRANVHLHHGFLGHHVGTRPARDHARRRLRAKRGGGDEPLDVHEIEIASPIPDDEVLVRLSDALEKYAATDSRKAALVKLRYFVGMTHEEAAATLGIAVPTAKQWWAYARAWLAVEMRRALPD